MQRGKEEAQSSDRGAQTKGLVQKLGIPGLAQQHSQAAGNR